MISIKWIFLKIAPPPQKKEAYISGIEFTKYKTYTRFTVKIQSSCVNLPFQMMAPQCVEASETQRRSVTS